MKTRQHRSRALVSLSSGTHQVFDVTAANPALTDSGLRLANLRLVPADTKNLELDFDGDGARNVYDTYALTVRALWPGGSYDGWDRDAMVASTSLEPLPTGTLFLLR